jgi:hypothetical protein
VIAALSIAPLLAIERGNIDLLIFFLLFLGCTATNRFLRSGVFLAATVLKIYPIAAQIVDAIRRPLKENRVAIAAMIAAAALWTWKWRELEAIRHAAMAVTTTLTFGMFAENSVALGLYQGIPLEDFATFTLFAMILPILLQQAGAFFMNTATLFQSSANVAVSHDKVIG